jgi:hypothetical protein
MFTVWRATGSHAERGARHGSDLGQTSERSARPLRTENGLPVTQRSWIAAANGAGQSKVPVWRPRMQTASICSLKDHFNRRSGSRSGVGESQFARCKRSDNSLIVGGAADLVWESTALKIDGDDLIASSIEYLPK